MTIKVGKVGMIPTVKVIVGEDRTREVMGDLEGLKASMDESGLIQPLAVKDNHDGTYLLLAGERRYTVLALEGISDIPARIYDEDLSPLEIKVIEKAENFYKKDMEYYEYDRLTLEIHRMKQELLGTKAPGPGGDGWGTRDTAELLGDINQATVVQAIKRAEAREAFPELFATCKTASDASKVISKVSEASIKQQLAEKIATQSVDITLDKLNKSFIIKDFFVGVKDIPDGLFHLVEIDPPYAIDYTKYKKIDGESSYQLDNYNEIDQDTYKPFIQKLFKECYRVMQPNSWLLCWFSMQPWFETFYHEIRNTGFGVSRHCAIWTKNTPGQNLKPNTRLSTSYDAFFYAHKGQPVLNKPGRANSFNFPRIQSNQQTHPTERPIELYKEIYNTFAFTGSRILIPFLGSGNGLLAATEIGMNAMGFELSSSYKDSFLVKAHLMTQKA